MLRGFQLGRVSGYTFLLAQFALACSSEDPGQGAANDAQAPVDAGTTAPMDVARSGDERAPDAAPVVDASRASDGDGPSTTAPDARGQDATVDAPIITGCTIPASDDDQPMLLSKTGCVDPSDPTKPAAQLIAYDVKSPLWSDGAAKQRFILLPPGKKIHVKDCAVDTAACSGDFNAGATGEDEGHWDLPVGTILMKTFAIGGKLIETRLLMHTDDRTWSGFSYEWNGLGAGEKQTEATLLPGEKDKPLGAGTAGDAGTREGGAPRTDGGAAQEGGATVDGGGVQTWHFPSREQCLQCHTTEGGRSLGPSTQQLNFTYNGMNQVDAFIARGVFDATPKKIDAYPTPLSSTGTVDARARSYLQANCAICHRPGGALMDIDLRFTTPFKNTNLCNADIVRGTGGSVPQKRLVPASPGTSALSYRMHDLGPSRMPKVGSNVLDSEGTKLIDDWITSIQSCQ